MWKKWLRVHFTEHQTEMIKHALCSRWNIAVSNVGRFWLCTDDKKERLNSVYQAETWDSPQWVPIYGVDLFLVILIQ